MTSDVCKVKSKVAIIIPSYNEGERLYSTLRRLENALEFEADFEFHVVIIDDASFEPVSTASMPVYFDVHVLTHPINLGQGAALETGFSYCRRTLEPDFIVTFDADGQHNSSDIAKFLKGLIAYKRDILFGNRFREGARIPMLRAFILRLACLFERKITGLALNDAHNGFRVFNRKCLHVMHLKQNRMAHATEIKQLVSKNGLAYGEMETEIVYTDETIQKGQSNFGAFIILRDLFKSYLFDRI